jgi:ATP-dependent Lon protease
MQNHGIIGISHKDASQDGIKYSLVCKLSRFNDIIQKTYTYIWENKKKNIIKGVELKTSICELRSSRKFVNLLYENVQKVSNSNYDNIIVDLQKLNTDLSNIIKKWGTYSFKDFLYVCFGKDYSTNILKNIDTDMFNLLEKQFHPLRYTMFGLSGNTNTRIDSKDIIHEYRAIDVINNLKSFDCLEISGFQNNSLQVQINGMILYIKNPKTNMGMFISGILDDMDIDLVNSSFINNKYIECISGLPPDIKEPSFINFLHCMNMKKWFVCKCNVDIYNLYMGGLSETKIFKQQSLLDMSSEFVSRTLHSKRNILLYLLLDDDDVNNRYIAYFLYDLLSNNETENGDTREQTELLDSFTWKMHELFNNALVETVQYTNKINKVDSSKINMEQQICLLKVDDIVKEKAMVKLRELKSKTDDSGTKARQYLEGLIKIPFGVYSKENIMNSSINIKLLFKDAVSMYKPLMDIINKDKLYQMNIIDIQRKMNQMNTPSFYNISLEEMTTNIMQFAYKCDKKSLIIYFEEVFLDIYNYSKLNLIEYEKFDIEKKTKTVILNELEKRLDIFINSNKDISKNLVSIFFKHCDKGYSSVNSVFMNLTNQYININEYMKNVSVILDESVHGHKMAKSQIMRVIGQWISGEQVGHCFGFEGAPGVGKTSLSKYGLSKCLIGENGESRPFSMIAIGGDANGSTLHGHNYTYVGSTWGAIVQILMDKKCMNPIIFIDELDKISKTEHGRELIGILTHMLDPTQNDKFQDKYFSGIDIDLSKVLFVLSYNDVEQIDKILLDRIHRIKFSHLSIDEKIHIAKVYTLPEIYKTVGVNGSIEFSEESIHFIIDNYTCEAGVRKLKEKLFEIVSDINLKFLTNSYDGEYPIKITPEDVKNTYFKDLSPIIIQQVPSESRIGYANGLWANSIGQGGTLPIEALFYPTGDFLKLKLTGKQGDVMQESMNVAMTLAYRLTSEDNIKKLSNEYNQNVKYGIHIHTPDGAISKDGPSAGSCITVVLYSLMNNKHIKNGYGITGEIQLDGKITAIGGLDLKILGSIKSGIKNYCYPGENQRDFDKFFEKYKDKEEIKGINFYSVNTIDELLKHIIV